MAAEDPATKFDVLLVGTWITSQMWYQHTQTLGRTDWFHAWWSLGALAYLVIRTVRKS